VDKPKRQGCVRAADRMHNHNNDVFRASLTVLSAADRAGSPVHRPRRKAVMTSLQHVALLFSSSARMSAGAALSVAATLSAALCWATPAGAQAKLEANYRASLGGIPVGRGAWTVDIGPDQYTMAANAKSGGVLSMLSGGEGSAAARGSVQAGKLNPAAYIVNIKTSRGRWDEVRMGINGGTVKDLEVEPVLPPNPERVPLTEAHKRGVMDPMTAGVLPNPSSPGIGAEACQRTLPIFDGRMRYDLALSFKRMDQAEMENGYRGPAAVCAVTYRPVSGHHPERFAIRYLRDNRDMEMWLIPITGTRFVAIYRVIIPTMVGTAMLEATRFVSMPRPMKANVTGGASVATR
jgi:hypothetical protein